MTLKRNPVRGGQPTNTDGEKDGFDKPIKKQAPKPEPTH